MQNLQQLLENKTEEHERLLRLFFALQDGSDELATNLLARMRMGEGFQALAQELGASRQSATRYVVLNVRLLEPLLQIRKLLTIIRDRPDVSDSQNLRSIPSWPPSPFDQGGWNTWDPRSPQGRTMSLSSEARLSVPGTSSSYYTYPVPNRAPQMDGESPAQEHGPYFQGQNTPDGEIKDTEEPAATSDASQSFVVPRRPSRGRSR